MKTSSWLWLATLIFIPSVSFAANIKLFSGNVVIDDEASAFRFRENPGLWQRSTLAADQTLDLQQYGDYLYLTTLSGGEYELYRSREGLSYEQVWSSSSQISLVKSEKLIAVSDTSAKVFSESGLAASYDLPAALTDPQNSLVATEQQVLVVIERAGGLDIFDLTISSTQPKWSMACTSSYFFTAPAVVVGCDNSAKTIVAGELEGLVADGQLTSSSRQALLWSLPIVNQYIIFDGEELVTLEFNNLQPEDRLEVASDRLFLHQTSALYEVAWRSDPINIIELPEVGELRVSGALTLLEATNIYYSRTFGSWQQTNLNETGLEYIDTEQGVIGYLMLGSLTYAEQAPGNFLVMPDTWAVSSKIKAVAQINNSKLLLILRNSSNNPNLYQSTDYRSWQRITLPGQSTHLLPIDQARLLPADTLVELVGKISVLPGWVSNNIGYLADNSGAIQFFLSGTRGSLVVDDYRHAALIGEVSSSQVGRVIMEDLSHLILGDKYQLTLKSKKIEEAKTNPGGSFVLKGKVDDVNTNDGILTDDSGSIKLHYDGIKEKYAVGSTIEVSAVFDLNSSSGQVEAWYTGQRSRLVLSAPAKQKIVSTSPAPASAASSPKIPTATVAQPTVVAEQPSAIFGQDNNRQPLVSAERSEGKLPTPLIFLSGLIVGVLVVRGRRFARFSNGI